MWPFKESMIKQCHDYLIVLRISKENAQDDVEERNAIRSFRNIGPILVDGKTQTLNRRISSKNKTDHKNYIRKNLSLSTWMYHHYRTLLFLLCCC